MIRFSAPGKVYLFGEHAVVYGEPALAAAIDKRIYVSIEERNDKEIKIFSEDLCYSDIEVSLSIEGGITLDTGIKTLKPLSYVMEVINKTREEVEDPLGFNIEIESDLPLGGGLGSSAAVTVASIKALSGLYSQDLSLEEIAEKAYKVEKKVQKKASPCDTFTSTMGGYTRVVTGETLEKKKFKKHPVVVGFTGSSGSTAEMVNKVGELKEKYPEVIDPLISSIGETTERGIKALEKNNLDHVGRLMNVNHGLLDAIGVSNKNLNEMVYISRRAGAHGAKITGAGGGGCIVALGENQKGILKALRATGFNAFKTEITREGVKAE